jgi:hypothetical protein
MYTVDTLIGDITPPESLMKTLTDRKMHKNKKLLTKLRESTNSKTDS